MKYFNISRNSNLILFITLLLGWFTLNIFQSVFTEIGNDESYYWVYSKFLAWGYFDHPPMVAVMIWLSNLFFDNELGVRLFTAIIQIPFLIILFKLTDVKLSQKAIWLFFIFSFSIVMIQAYGFVTTPDSPMLFFTGLFLWSYKLFIDKESTKNILFLSISMALLMYSKYHGVLVIGFVILSNLKLFINPRFYLAGIIALVLFIPHLFWQYDNNFPTFAYHLVDRSGEFKWSRLFEFFANQLAVFNPVTLGVVVYVLFKRKVKDRFERTLVFQILGFFIFFTLSNFKGYVNPHWTIAAACAMIILLVRESVVNEKLAKFAYRFIAPTFALILIARLALMVDFIPFKSEWHGHKQRMKDLGKITGSTPVIFFNQFQDPSKYYFYTKKPVHSIGCLKYRDTQYDIWNFDESFRGDSVILVSGAWNKNGERVTINENDFYIVRVGDYMPYKRLKVDLDFVDLNFVREKPIEVNISINNPYTEPFDLNHKTMPIDFIIVLSNKYRVFHNVDTEYSVDKSIIDPGETISGSLKFTIPEEYFGKYKLWLCHTAHNFCTVSQTPYKHIEIQ
jgi:hypothetical protein